MSVRHKHPGQTTVGFVMIPRSGPHGPTPYSLYGHTAILVRMQGKVVRVSGWVPVGAVPSTKATVPGKWQDDEPMVDYEQARSFEFVVQMETATKVVAFLNNAAANAKWNYHFSGKEYVVGARSKNCVQAAINVLAKEQDDPVLKEKARALKKGIKDELAKHNLTTASELGYSQQVALSSASALWPA